MLLVGLAVGGRSPQSLSVGVHRVRVIFRPTDTRPVVSAEQLARVARRRVVPTHPPRHAVCGGSIPGGSTARPTALSVAPPDTSSGVARNAPSDSMTADHHPRPDEGTHYAGGETCPSAPLGAKGAVARGRRRSPG
jgi:hypothetical protein